MPYTPSEELLAKYADVLVNYGLNNGAGVREKETVMLRVPECAKPLLKALYVAVLEAGAYPLVRYGPDGLRKTFFEHANDDQLTHVPMTYLKGAIEEADHSVAVIADTDKHELSGVDPKRIMRRSEAMKPYVQMRDEKEHRGEFTWTLCLYGTEEMSSEVGLSLEEYWDQIVRACYLDKDDPVAKWKELAEEMHRIRDALNELSIERVHVDAEHIDLTVKLGEGREWLAATGKNIPSYEHYISPDWRGTEGEIRFTEPLYRYGNLIDGAYLRFEDGVVVEASAEKGEDVLKEMLASDGGDRVGEFSLTDKRFSRIDTFMGETMYDENVGADNGNTHIALGRAYKDSHPDGPRSVPDEEWERLGYNFSVVHTDIVSTEPRTVTATLADGSKKVIYEDGMFTV